MDDLEFDSQWEILAAERSVTELDEPFAAPIELDPHRRVTVQLSTAAIQDIVLAAEGRRATVQMQAVR